MGEAARRKKAETYPAPTSDDAENQRFLNRPDVLAFAQSPEGMKLLRPGLLRFLADVGVTPQVDSATGEVVVDMPTMIAALGITEDEAAEILGDQTDNARIIPADRLKPLQ
jgi:hypothetical protein